VSRAAQVLVIGVGNRMRSDDAAGLEVIDRLRALPREQLGPAVRLCEHEGEGLGLLAIWESTAAVVLVDAIEGASQPGSLVRIDASTEPVPASARSGSSTHAVGVVEAIELARALGRLPARVVLCGVVGARFEAGERLSAHVRGAIPALTEMVLAEVSGLGGGVPPGAGGQA